MKASLPLLLLTLFLYACGPSEEELRVRDEHIRIEAENRIKEKLAWQDSVKRYTTLKQKNEYSLMDAKASLDAAADQMNDIKGFKFLRSSSERAEQIKDQNMLIQRIEKNIQILSRNVTVIESNISYAKDRISSL